jgi:hypothetical protein
MKDVLPPYSGLELKNDLIDELQRCSNALDGIAELDDMVREAQWPWIEKVKDDFQAALATWDVAFTLR